MLRKKAVVIFLSLLSFNTFADSGCLSKLSEAVLDKKLVESSEFYARVKSPVNCQAAKNSYESLVCSDNKLKKLDLLAIRKEIYNYESATAHELVGKELKTYINSSLHWTQSTCKTKECVCKKLSDTDQLNLSNL